MFNLRLSLYPIQAHLAGDVDLLQNCIDGLIRYVILNGEDEGAVR